MTEYKPVLTDVFLPFHSSYGDVVPQTVFGKILGSTCCVFGLFVVSLVVPVIQEKEKT